MAPLSLKEEPGPETDGQLTALEITEMKWETSDNEVIKLEGQQHLSMALITSKEESAVSKFKSCPGREALQYNQNFRKRARLTENSYSIENAINLTRSFLDDFFHMSQCHKSLYCAKIPLQPMAVRCVGCGKHFIGRSNRILKLIDHIESKHKKHVKELLADAILRYGLLLEHMRKFLHKDRRLILARYD